jgi:hypothetical protein
MEPIVSFVNYKFKIYDNSHLKEDFKHRKNIKLYLLELTFKDTGEKIHKFGVTSHFDVVKRMEKSEKNPEYEMFIQPVKALASAYLPVNEALEQEKFFQNHYKKNISIRDPYKFGGISETLFLFPKDRMDSIKKIMALHREYKAKRLNLLEVK